ncbi:hypothetical protein H6B14_15810, partial [Phocaeicola coprophilus]|nr:hypothetical protein [Phocaeicola coprophilus]
MKITLGPVATDKWWRTYYDPAFVAKIDEPMVGGILIHEINHLIRRHFERVGTRNPLLWNVAGDLEINDDLSANGIKLPAGAQFPG